MRTRCSNRQSECLLPLLNNRNAQTALYAYYFTEYTVPYMIK